MTESFGDTVAREVKGLRGYAVRLTMNATRADDLMQDTVLRALAAEATFTVGTNLAGWLTTIMRATPAEAADAFAVINGRVTTIHALNVWGARIAAGDKDAVALDRLTQAEGVLIKRYPVPTLKLRPGQTVALGTLQRGVRELGEAGVALALRILMRAHPGERGVLTAPMIGMALAIVRRLQDERPAAIMAALRGVSLTEALLSAPPAERQSRKVEIATAAIVNKIREQLCDD